MRGAKRITTDVLTRAAALNWARLGDPRPGLWRPRLGIELNPAGTSQDSGPGFWGCHNAGIISVEVSLSYLYMV